jgi:hypothetical protein
MLNDPRDSGAYRIAIAALGLALAVLLAGICWIAAVHVTGDTVQMHKTTVHVDKRDLVHDERVTVHMERDTAPLEMGQVPVELWFVLAALGGVFVGALIPFNLRVKSSKQGGAYGPEDFEPDRLVIVVGAILLIAGGIGTVEIDSVRWQVLAIAVVGLLLGLPIPSPGRRDP